MTSVMLMLVITLVFVLVIKIKERRERERSVVRVDLMVDFLFGGWTDEDYRRAFEFNKECTLAKADLRGATLAYADLKEGGRND